MRSLRALAPLALAPLVASCSALLDVDTGRLDRADASLPVDAPIGTDMGPTTDQPLTDSPAGDAGDVPAGDAGDVPAGDAGDATALDAGDVPVGDVPVTDAGDAPLVDAPAPDDVPGDDVPPDAASDPCGGCDDEVACTTDVCDRVTGRCVFTPVNAACPAMNICDVAARGCVRVDCTSNADCDDRDRCNGDETCSMGRCQPGPPVTCDDGVACTIDRCDPATGACSAPTDDARCDDGIFCNGAEVCTPAGCRAGSPVACDDRVACTVDRCDEASRRCASTPNPGACPARGPCVSVACDAARGCVYAAVAGYCDSFCVSGATCNVDTGNCQGGGTPRNCSDGNACTVDACDPSAMMCRNTAVDADMDGFPAARVGAMACAGGTDCDDSDPDVSPRVMEVCNGVDDNCNGAVDEGGVCGAPGDDCSRVVTLDLTATNTVTVAGSTATARDDFDTVCGGSGPDVVYALRYPTNAEVMIEVLGSGGADHTLSLRDACNGAEFVCNGDATRSTRNARVFLRSTPGSPSTRTSYVVIDSPSAGGAFQLRAVRTAAVPPASCSTNPLVNVTAGGTVWGYVYTNGGSHVASCGGLNRDEDVLRYDAPRGGRTTVNLLLATANYVVYARQDQCGGLGADSIACGGALSTVAATLRQGPAWFFVDGANNSSGGRYVLRVMPP